jgi:hypothetical protein
MLDKLLKGGSMAPSRNKVMRRREQSLVEIALTVIQDLKFKGESETAEEMEEDLGDFHPGWRHLCQGGSESRMTT